MKRFLSILFALLVFPAFAQSISPYDAQKHIGESSTVCGTVASAKYAEASRRQPTFLNLGASYPHEPFTAVIWGSDRPKWKEPPEIAYRMKQICVTGLVQLYKGKPEIIVHGPEQITLLK
jgi:DNA/RNA endonuclease YhcR with UshA esterase domain